MEVTDVLWFIAIAVTLYLGYRYATRGQRHFMQYVASLDQWMQTFSLEPNLLNIEEKGEIILSALETHDFLQQVMPDDLRRAENARNRAFGHNPVETYLKDATRVLSVSYYGRQKFQGLYGSERLSEADDALRRAVKDGGVDTDHTNGVALRIMMNKALAHADLQPASIP